jgi:hypothetical protein
LLKQAACNLPLRAPKPTEVKSRIAQRLRQFLAPANSHPAQVLVSSHGLIPPTAQEPKWQMPAPAQPE